MEQQVFISYRNESLHHRRAVRRLADSLRQSNIPVALDQFVLEKEPAGPDVGWPRWCEDCYNNSACALIIASEGWFAAYEGRELPGKGAGAAGEANLFRQELWDQKGNNSRVRLVFLSDISVDSVPRQLRAWQQFRPHANKDELNALTRWIATRLGLANIELSTVRWPEPLNFYPDLADRTKEWPAIVRLLAGQLRERIVLCEGPSGTGKSALINQAVNYAKTLSIPVVRVDFKGGGQNIQDILGQFYLELGEQLPNFSREGAEKTHLLRKDLRTLRQPVLVVFDSYEDAIDNQTVVNWLNQHFLGEVGDSRGLAVIIAGQHLPDHRKAGWGDLVLHFPLNHIEELAHWRLWAKHRFPNYEEKEGRDLKTLLNLSGGLPSSMANWCEVVFSKGGSR